MRHRMLENRKGLVVCLLALTLAASCTQARTLKELQISDREEQRNGGIVPRNGSPFHGSPFHKQKAASCNICPDAEAIKPCICKCNNVTSADIICNNSLQNCQQLSTILKVATPVSQYLRLVVQNTSLTCILKNDIWGQATFQEILMKDNGFTTIDNHAFAHFNNSLKILNFEYNKLSNICFQTFSNQPHLEIINLSNNNLVIIPGSANMKINKLRELLVTFNKLTSVQTNTFVDMPNLEKIDFAFNQIGHVDKGAFAFKNRPTKNSTLEIDLSYNNIQAFNGDMISGVENVTINLMFNHITSLEGFRQVFDNTNNKAKILLSGNLITCDFAMCWIVSNKTIMNSFDNFQCNNGNMYLYDLTSEDLGCDGTLRGH